MAFVMTAIETDTETIQVRRQGSTTCKVIKGKTKIGKVEFNTQQKHLRRMENEVNFRYAEASVHHARTCAISNVEVSSPNENMILPQ